METVELVVNNCVINNWKSYRINADMYSADGAFEFECSSLPAPVNPGQRCQVWVNGQLEMTGIIDAISASYSKRDYGVVITGRDMMGQLIDNYIGSENWKSWSGVSIRTLAQSLMSGLPYINVKQIVFENGVESSVVPEEFTQTEPGQTVFDVLRNVAGNRGFLFYCAPDGTMIFGKPKASGESKFALQNSTSGHFNNINSAKFINDISKRYRKVIVAGQSDGSANVISTYEDKTFMLSHKTFVTTVTSDTDGVKNNARLILEKLKRNGFNINYTVNGHSQAGKNWTINEMCSVADVTFNIDCDLLLYGRTFIMSKNEGTKTEIVLGLPGVIG